VWDEDPQRAVYEQTEWPEEFQLYVSPAKSCGAAIQEFAERHVGEPIGFIGQDTVVLTPGSAQELEREAGQWCLAWPNDLIQRWALPIHFCIGPALVKALQGVVVPPELPHNNLDGRLKLIADNLGVGRYRPDLLWVHMHPCRGLAPHDEVSEEVLSFYAAAEPAWEAYVEKLRAEIRLARKIMFQVFEKEAREWLSTLS
jgi:hypothetical protein